ncbi:MAG: phosphatidate cytidylyltransferase [bacterium]
MNVRNLIVRVLVAAVAIPLLILLFDYGKWPYLAFVMLVTLLAVWEFLTLTGIRLFLWQKPLLTLLAMFPALDFYLWSGQHLYEFLIGLILLLSLPQVFTRKLENLGRSLGLGLFGVLYPSLGLSALILIRLGGPVSPASAGGWVIFLFATVWIVDTAAYFLGMAFGDKKLSPVVSPKKTVIGFVCGFAGAPLAAFLVNITFLTEESYLRLLWPALLIALVGQLADLAESLFKREVGVKDSSNLIPGHGGALDRFDSVILAGPVLYFFLKYLY